MIRQLLAYILGDGVNQVIANVRWDVLPFLLFVQHIFDDFFEHVMEDVAEIER